MTAANIVTSIRIILIPLLIYTLKYDRDSSLPLIIFSICIATDLLDGILARALNTRTALGKFLDPMADKLLLVSLFLALTLLQRIPLWLFIVALSRDIFMVAGWLGILVFTGINKVKIRISGKLTVVFQMATLFSVMLKLPLLPGLFYITGFVTVFSALDYLAREIREAGKK